MVLADFVRLRLTASESKLLYRKFISLVMFFLFCRLIANDKTADFYRLKTYLEYFLSVSITETS